jgi:hypothetical protein
MATVTGIIESLLVKMKWRRTLNFIVFALAMSLLTSAAALIGGAYAHHGL